MFDLFEPSSFLVPINLEDLKAKYQRIIFFYQT